ncbi:MAG TPA: 1,4-beta-xylanase [Balneolaceae bacterium]|nr:1,4-beta-xylanase [Balneolaceae bacterium]|tara:strand:+ start:31197 stop:32252 length:1056 start_codon:yes stop_codon:yes gene_type:complete
MAGLLILVSTIACSSTEESRSTWSQQQANEWYKNYDWMVGANFNPSTAINQLETWQAETFDSVTIDRELGWAEDLGMNVMRVYLHHVAWQQDPDGFISRMDQYLKIADSHGIKTMFVFFDDCWNPVYEAGSQPEPKPGIHNSGWVQDPGRLIHEQPELIDTLEVYVKDVLVHFADDNRIVMWDLYNEPGNSGYGNKSMPLLKAVFSWGKEVDPSQPLTAGVWNPGLSDLNKFQLSNSDVITYHNYEPKEHHAEVVDSLKAYGKPIFCTEYMARTRKSTFQDILPILKKDKISAINWGLVSGRSNTIYAWDTPMPSGEEPEVWFHDIFRKDGSVYSEEEIAFIKAITGKAGN